MWQKHHPIRAADFADKFGNAEWAYAAGMLHDIGKYSKKILRKLLDDSPKMDHVTAGASVARVADSR